VLFLHARLLPLLASWQAAGLHITKEADATAAHMMQAV
jgi:hypothetical protein